MLLAIAAPSFVGFVTQARVYGHDSDLIDAINLARASAVQTGASATVCRSSDQQTCATTGTGWESGWIVFTDPNYNQTVDTGETILHVWPTFTNGDTATPTTVGSSITYFSNGRPAPTFTGGVIEVCPGGTNTTNCRYICINSQGRPRVDMPTQYATDAICGN